MKRYSKLIIYLIIFIIIITLAVIGYNYLTKKYYPDEVGGEENQSDLNKANDFEVLDINGNKVKLSDFYGKPIVVNFWATWCGPCKTELPEFEEMYNEYNEKIEFLMVNLTDGYNDTVENVKEFIRENNYEFPVYFDTEYSATNAYRIYSIPQTLFIDKDGNIIKLYKGQISRQTLQRYIEKMLEDASDI